MKAHGNTHFPTKEQAGTDRKWVVVDAADQTVGRLATRIASVLRGKNKTTFTPHVDTGDFVIVVNAAKVRFSGKKAEKKVYYQYSGYIGGLKGIPASDLLAKHPEQVIERAVQGMLPTGPLGFAMLKKLKIFNGPEHIHGAQVPTTMTVNE